jgi:hypothetical protein
MLDTLDSYFHYVKTQMAIIDASQRFGGVVMSRDWPQDPPIGGALYLLYIQSVPTPLGTQAQNHFEYFCQWVWILIGNDITSTQQAANRGDRYRGNIKIMENLRQANYPCYTQKLQVSAVNQQTGVLTYTPVTSQYPASNLEMITWTKPRFMPKGDEKSGLIYGAAAVQVSGFDDVDIKVA